MAYFTPTEYCFFEIKYILYNIVIYVLNLEWVRIRIFKEKTIMDYSNSRRYTPLRGFWVFKNGI